jgi:uncharacterized protein (TIGR02265 family)
MPLEKLVFGTTVEALFVRGLGAGLSPTVRARLRQAGLDLSRPLEVSYPLEEWKTFVHIAAVALYPRLCPAEAHGWMGVHFLEGYLQTFMGRVVAGLAPTLGPGRTLERMRRDFCGGNNFSEVKLVERSPWHAELWVNDVFSDYSSFAAGLISRAQQVAGARDVQVDVLSFDGTACTFDIRWADAGFIGTGTGAGPLRPAGGWAASGRSAPPA